ncbi:hypothetical protein AC623_20675 [Bacillus sp. FJAT-27231]|uniref:hypothetical protein n=1 Tax=Bacillus sp. FJAT-27231 TaxID=1679168 RepID=UPI00067103BB|nr:hypothetical protein [Bacillus sp. FJAT-27231]KMY52553.1 hypothetical protein AC623_20675 [Bacillus sp. FJAT-27231]
MKTKFFLICTFVFLVMTGCSEKAEIIELSPNEMKEFMSSEGNGFIMLDYDEDDRDFWMNSVKNAIKKQKAVVRELNEEKIAVANEGLSRPSEYGLKQKRDSLAYYQDGEVKGEIKFEDYKPSELEKELEFFIKSMNETYSNK